MPPVGFFASVASSYDTASGNVTFLTPSGARASDVLIAVVSSTVFAPTLTLPTGWTQLSKFTGINTTIYVCRHQVTDAEPAQHVFVAQAAMNPQPTGLMLQYRSLDAAAALVDSILGSVTPANANYPAPAITLATYSDLGLLVYYALDAAGTATFTMPGGATQRGITHGPGGIGGGTLCVADYLQEATGTTGTKTAVCSAPFVGTASNYALQALPTLQPPFVIPDVAGAIGLTTVGV